MGQLAGCRLGRHKVDFRVNNGAQSLAVRRSEFHSNQRVRASEAFRCPIHVADEVGYSAVESIVIKNHTDCSGPILPKQERY